MMRFEWALTRALEKHGLAEPGSGKVLESLLDANFVDAELLVQDARAAGNIAIPFVKQLTAQVKAAQRSGGALDSFGRNQPGCSRFGAGPANSRGPPATRRGDRTTGGCPDQSGAGAPAHRADGQNMAAGRTTDDTWSKAGRLARRAAPGSRSHPFGSG